MNYLYKGKKRIKAVTIKTKVNTDFITATESDIVSGKQSIDTDYNTITGTMVITENIVNLTPGATAVASDITEGATGYKDGIKITGTAVREKVNTVVPGIIHAYQVANNNVISAGDFVHFVEEICGCGYETKNILSESVYIESVNADDIAILEYDINKILLFFNDANLILHGSIITIDNGIITYTEPQSFSNLDITARYKLFSIENGKIVFIFNNRAALVTVSNDIITIGQSISAASSTIRGVTLLDTNEIFITSEGWDGYSNIIEYSRIRIENGNLVATLNIPSDRTLYPATEAQTICRLSHNKLLLAYAQSNFNRASNIIVLDISDPNYVYSGQIYTLSTSFTSALNSMQVEDGVAMVSYYVGYSSDGVGYIACCKLEDGLNIDINKKTFGINGSNVSRTEIRQLTPTLSVLGYFGRNDLYHIIPISTIPSTNDFTYGTGYQFGGTGRATRILNVENNKIFVAYISLTSAEGYRMTVKSLQINNNNIVTDILTVYDMTKPLTTTMVALSVGPDRIDGISNDFGIGRLYGGDLINIITPDV